MTQTETVPPFQCNLCGSTFNERPKLCSECGSPSIRDVKKTGWQLDVVTEDSVAHFKKKITPCWNERPAKPGEGKPGQKGIKHDLDLGTRPVVDTANQEWHLESYCRTCGSTYSWAQGRAATVLEMEQASQGKIRKPDYESAMGKA